MCGIVGTSGNSDELPLMMDAIRHRGPDDSGFLKIDGVQFGFRRLSIVDLAGGHQPFYDSSGIMCVVNGEIYNHKTLRKDLQDLGHKFKSESDGEAVLYAYKEWGEQAFSKLEGMFGLAIYDSRTKDLYLARDPLGKKPVYWAYDKLTGFFFASELKAILQSSSYSQPDIDIDSVSSYFISDSVPTPRTIFKGIYKLAPGSYLKYSKGAPTLTSFWLPTPESQKRANSFDEAVLNAEVELTQSVSQRLMADVPIGVFLSSGVDSMAVASIASKLSPNRLDSFTLAFQDNSYDESNAAAVFAEQCGFRHHQIDVSEDIMVDQLHKQALIFDEPLNDPAALVQLSLAEAASAHIKVALTGDGGDELFWGYRHVNAHQVLSRFPNRAVRELKHLSKLAQLFPDKGGYFSFAFKAQRMARGFEALDWVERDMRWRGAVTPEDVSELLTLDSTEILELERLRSIVGNASWAKTEMDKWSWLYIRSYLLDTVLVKVDRATMAHGVEARSPLLDQNFVNYALSIPGEFKTGKYGNKQIMRSVLSRQLPVALPASSKHGMGIPVTSLLRGPLNELLEDLLSNDFITKQGIFSPDKIRKLYTDFKDSKRDLRKEIWGLLIFQVWYSTWFSPENRPNYECELEN